MKKNFITRQRGVVLIITLLVLVTMTLASVAIMRSMNTSSLSVSGQTFRATGNATGAEVVERVVQGLIQTASRENLNDPKTLLLRESKGFTFNGVQAEYVANALGRGESEEGIPEALLNVSGRTVAFNDADTGNTAFVLVERLCQKEGRAVRKECVVGAQSNGMDRNLHDTMPDPRGMFSGKRTLKVFHRVTVRVNGPNNAVSYTQAVVNLRSL